MSPENRPGFLSVAIFLSCKSSAVILSVAATAWVMKVAQATPFTPQLNTITNTQSSKMLPTDEKIRNISGVRLLPSAVNTPFAIL